MNTLYYGDNLPILCEYIQDESIDLVYLDPPFNSNRSYNVLFKEEGGKEAEAQITAFDDTWHWGPVAERTYDELLHGDNMQVATMINAMRQFIGTNQMMAYLVMMAARLSELHRVLKPTGSLYLHCDPTASHYLKILLDTIFGYDKFRTEIVWKRSSAHSDTKQGRKQHGRIHDVIFFYSKTNDWKWNPVYTPYETSYVEEFYRFTEPETNRRYRIGDLTAAKPGGDTTFEWRVKKPQNSVEWEADLEQEYLSPKPGWEYKGVPPYNGRFWAYSLANMIIFAKEGRLIYTKSGMPGYKRYIDEMPGVPLQDVWNDIRPIGALAAERLGYPTQKPLALLERIIQASSNPGDVVLDPFSGCGTAIAAAQKLGREWIGIDITHLSIAMHKNRLKDMFGLQPNKDYRVIGEPETLSGAFQLALDDRFQFQWWALSLVQARPIGATDDRKKGKKGADQGIDGVIPFSDEAKKLKKVLVQVKSGHVTSKDIRDLRGVLDRETDAPIAVFITLSEPTRPMIEEAASAGFYESMWYQQKYPRLQILTVEQLLAGRRVEMPPSFSAFKQAEKVKESQASQSSLGI